MASNRLAAASCRTIHKRNNTQIVLAYEACNRGRSKNRTVLALQAAYSTGTAAASAPYTAVATYTVVT